MRIQTFRFTTSVMCIVLLLSTPAWAVPLTGFLEGSADTGWQGAFAVQLTDGTVVTGMDKMTLLASFSSLPLTTVECSVSPSCVAVTNLNTSTVFTMSGVILNLAGTATLGSLGTVSWGAQPLWVLPGDPSPTVAVLADLTGTLGGTTLTGPSSAFAFNATLTASFISVAGGQALSSIRLDFTDGTPPPTSRTLMQGPVFIDNGVAVALGTPLAVTERSPDCTAAKAFPAVLWSPKHQFVPVVVMGVTDPDGDAVTITVTRVTQDEPVNGKGDGNTSPDAVIHAGAASVRAERSGIGNGRVYQVSFEAEDGKGGICIGAVTVSVPHSLKKGLTAIDDGQVYDSTVGKNGHGQRPPQHEGKDDRESRDGRD